MAALRAQVKNLPTDRRLERAAPACVGLWGCFFARENARLELARIALATGAGHRTHAARGLNRAQRVRFAALGFPSSTRSAPAVPRLPGSWRKGGGRPPCSRSERSEASVAARGGGYQAKRQARAVEVIYSGCKTIGVGT